MYWRDYDITYQADDVSWAGLFQLADSPVVTAVDSSYIESDISSAEAITPALTSEKAISLFDEQVLNISFVYPLIEIGINGADTLQVIATAGVPLLKLFAVLTAIPVVAESVYIESETTTTASLRPSIVNVLETSLYSDETLLVAVEAAYPFAYSFGEDTLQPILLDVAAKTILQDTYLKRLDSLGWGVATIYLKESDGTWQQKPIYMKQIDKTWM